MSQLDVHVASRNEQLAAYENVHEFWGRGLSLEEFLKRRLASFQHNQATWYVGCLDDQVVTSLGAYRIQFQLQGTVHLGFAIGSVHTRSEHRGRGFAADLFRVVETQEASAGAQLSLLYSDIRPSYYKRLGYRTAPAWEGFCDATDLSTIQAEQTPSLVPLDLQHEHRAVAEHYGQYHQPFQLFVSRDEDYWKYLVHKDASDELFWIQAQARLGYVRLGVANDCLRIRDFALTDHRTETLQLMLAAVAKQAVQRDLKTIGGWLPNTAEFAQFMPNRREREITMLKPLSPEVALDEVALTDAQHFRETDHV